MAEVWYQRVRDGKWGQEYLFIGGVPSEALAEQIKEALIGEMAFVGVEIRAKVKV